jgi:hypothetical protein
MMYPAFVPMGLEPENVRTKGDLAFEMSWIAGHAIDDGLASARDPK